MAEWQVMQPLNGISVHSCVCTSAGVPSHAQLAVPCLDLVQTLVTPTTTMTFTIYALCVTSTRTQNNGQTRECRRVVCCVLFSIASHTRNTMSFFKTLFTTHFRVLLSIDAHIRHTEIIRGGPPHLIQKSSTHTTRCMLHDNDALIVVFFSVCLVALELIVMAAQRTPFLY